jgi:tungstate transport system substrate-binding protein
LLSALALASCASKESAVFRLATTTSTYDSGLLTEILPDFEQRFDVRVDTIAVGTGQAIAIGENGDADILLVHDREKEDGFIAKGFGTKRTPVMFNDFVVVGPIDDPAGIAILDSAGSAFAQIATMEMIFISRGDQSGTHAREISIWEKAGMSPGTDDEWYLSIGQGMGTTLQLAAEKQAYALSDRGTYLALSDLLIGLTILVGGPGLGENLDADLLNQYAVIPVNPDEYPSVDYEMALNFVAWITTDTIQDQIADFGFDNYQQALFKPIREYP